MGEVHVSVTVGDVMDGLVARARTQDIPCELADEIASATVRSLALQRWRRATPRDRRRAEAYFSEVVRRRTVRGSAGSRAVARLVAEAVVEDLRQTGRDGHAVFDQLTRGWSDRLPADVLEEYRLRLCG